MTKTIRLLTAAVVAGGLAVSVAAIASAQDGPAAAPPSAGPHRGWDRGDMRARFEERRQHRQQMLHDALGLRADQEGAWQAFVASAHRPDGERGPGMRHGEDGAGQALTTPERIDRMERRMAERQARFAQRADAVKRFYAVLDPRQQKTFDALVMARFGGHGMGMGMGRMGHGHMGHMGPPDGERG